MARLDDLTDRFGNIFRRPDNLTIRVSRVFKVIGSIGVMEINVKVASPISYKRAHGRVKPDKLDAVSSEMASFSAIKSRNVVKSVSARTGSVRVAAVVVSSHSFRRPEKLEKSDHVSGGWAVSWHALAAYRWPGWTSKPDDGVDAEDEDEDVKAEDAFESSPGCGAGSANRLVTGWDRPDAGMLGGLQVVVVELVAALAVVVAVVAVVVAVTGGNGVARDDNDKDKDEQEAGIEYEE